MIIFAADLQNNQKFQAILKCIFVTISFDFSSHDSSHDRDDKNKLHMHLFNEFKDMIFTTDLNNMQRTHSTRDFHISIDLYSY